MDVAAPVEAGTDCNDSSASEYPGSVEEASATECMRDADGDGYGDEDVSGTRYDPGTDCDASDASANNDDDDADGFTTCAGDCDDDAGSINPDREEVCDNSLDDNCDDRVDEYCDYDEATGTIHYYSLSGSLACSYELRSATSTSSSGCVDCNYHFYDNYTYLRSGSSTYCRASFSTWVGINESAGLVYLDTLLAGDAVEFYAEITSWRESTSSVSVSWATELYPYPSARYTNEVRGDLTLYGSW